MKLLRLHLYATLIVLIIIIGCSKKQMEPIASASPSPTQTASPTPTPTPPATPTPKPPVDVVGELVSKMSLAEKIGQMVLVGLEGTSVQPEISSLIKVNRVGGIIYYGNNIVSAAQTNKLSNDLKQVNQDADSKLPLLLSTDQEGGKVSRLPKEIKAFPSSMTIGKTNDTKYAYRVGTALGESLKAIGINTDFSPVLDINTNPNNPVIGDRAFGTTVKPVSSMGVQEMLGIKSQGVIPVVKHFPGHGDTSVDSHFGLPVVNHDLSRLRSTEFVPFSAAIKEGAPMVMVAHILMTKLDPNIPASMSRTVIQDYLRGELKFKGVVITDDMTMEAVGKVKAIGPASVDAVLAGADIILVGHDLAKQKSVIDALMAAAQSGKIPQSVIDASVKRIAKLKLDFRLSDQSTPLADVAMLNKHIEAALIR